MLSNHRGSRGLGQSGCWMGSGDGKTLPRRPQPPFIQCFAVACYVRRGHPSLAAVAAEVKYQGEALASSLPTIIGKELSHSDFSPLIRTISKLGMKSVCGPIFLFCMSPIPQVFWGMLAYGVEMKRQKQVDLVSY